MKTKLTPESLDLLLNLARTAGDWSGQPYVGDFTSDERLKGNLTDLKRKGLLSTFQEGTAVHVDEFGAEAFDICRKHGRDEWQLAAMRPQS